MKKTNENGITLVALIVTIVLLIILASIGVNSGTDTIKNAQFNKFQNELKILQTKVNELNQLNKTDIGIEPTETQKQIINVTEVANIIFNNKTESEKNDIISNFKYISKNNIKKELELDGITNDYLINVKYRYAVCCKGFEYNGTTYYMVEQFDTGLYNIGYTNKNNSNGIENDESGETTSFKIEKTPEPEKERCKISITNIKYDGYVKDWQVKYKIAGDETWQTSYNTEFYVSKPGYYIIKVVHENEIDLGIKHIQIIDGEDITKPQIKKRENTEEIDENNIIENSEIVNETENEAENL